MGRDLGEDMLAQIYDGERYRGLNFFVQLKSVDGIADRTTEGQSVSYSIDVAHLKRWDGPNPPVVIVIWDVSQREGYWASVESALKELNESNPRWASQESATVHVPLQNRMDDVGLSRIRDTILRHSEASIANGREMRINIKFAFAKTPDGEASLQALVHHVESGEAADIDGRCIDSLEFPGWWTRLHGDIDARQGRVILSPIVSDRVNPACIDLLKSGSIVATIPYLALRIVKQATRQVTLSNQGQDYPAYCETTIPNGKGKGHIHLKVSGPGNNVRQANEVLSLLHAMTGGCQLRLRFLSSGQ